MTSFLYATTLLIAILSPGISSAINTYHETKMYKLRFKNEHKAKIIENYIAYTGQRLFSPNMTTPLYMENITERYCFMLTKKHQIK